MVATVVSATTSPPRRLRPLDGVNGVDVPVPAGKSIVRLSTAAPGTVELTRLSIVDRVLSRSGAYLTGASLE